jgi:hypothetical protein
MERTISSDGMIKEGDDNVMVYYHSKYLFSKLKYRIENDEKKIKIGETIKVKLEVIDLGKIE